MAGWTDILRSQQPVRRSIDHTEKVFVVNRKGETQLIKQVICEDEASMQNVKHREEHMNHVEAMEVFCEKRLGGGTYVYVVKPLRSRSLQDDLSRQCVYYPEKQLWTYLMSLVDALAALQQQEIAHGDIQPKNLLLDNKDEIYVYDFGFGQSFEIDPETRKETILSTPFLSPKIRSQLLSGKYLLKSLKHNPYKSDVYSLGVTLLYLTMLKLPHFLTSAVGTAHLQHNFNELLSQKSFYSREWMEVLRWMLIVQEETRPDFLELQRGLKESLALKDDDIIDIRTEERESGMSVSVHCGLVAVRVDKNQAEKVPCMVSLKESEMSDTRHSVDLVCVLDVSGSMEECRLYMVQKALSVLIDKLDNRDRMCLVTFSDTAERHCPLIACTPEGKGLLKKLINGLCTYDLTNITAGFELAINVLLNRRIKSQAASILLLTDGVHNVGPPKEECLEILKQSMQGGLSKLNVHCFGFCTDLDAIFLRNLTTEGNGTLHCVSNAQDLEEAFLLSFSFLTRIVAREVRVSLQLISDSCQIKRVYSRNMMENSPEQKVIPMSDVAEGMGKDLVFILVSKYAAISAPFKQEVLEVVVTYKDFEGINREMRKKLEVKFTPWSDATPVKAEIVFSNLVRANGVEKLQMAGTLAEKGKFRKASEMLEDGIDYILASGYSERSVVQPILNDLKSLLPAVLNEAAWREGGRVQLCAQLHSHSHQPGTVSILCKRR